MFGTEFILVTIPEALSFNQVQNILHELEKNDFNVSQIIINNVVHSPDCDFLQIRYDMQQKYIQQIINTYSMSKSVTQLYQLPGEVKGLLSLRGLEKLLFGDD